MSVSQGQAKGQTKCTVVEDGTEFEGTVVSSCPLLVKGSVHGSVQAPSLTVDDGGVVHGKVQVTDLVSNGEVEGEFEATRMLLAGRVRDNTVLRAKSLEVKLASNDSEMQVVFGSARLVVGDEPVDSQEQSS